MLRIAALIVAAGRGERVGGTIPKQFREIRGVPMLRRSVEAFAARPDVSAIAVTAPSHALDIAANMLCGTGAHVVAGGANRQESVALGLTALAHGKPDLVLVHDAARPLVSQELINRVIAALVEGADAAIPLVTVTDTLKRKENGRWSTVPRDGLFRAQTPQGFHYAAILDGHERFSGREFTDDMWLAEETGLNIKPVPGDEANIKVTTEEDFIRAEMLIGRDVREYRTGTGFDVHRFVSGDHVWLCGVNIPHDRTLEGHSDADAGLHALTDALLGAICERDIGRHFPPSDAKWRGAASHLFLEHAARLLAEKAGTFVHCDITLICEKPKIGPHREAMRARIAEILGTQISRVSVKATTTEGMGFTGRDEGLAAQAIVTVSLPSS